MSLATVSILVLNGLTLAALLFLMASGLTLTFGLMRVVNLAHGGIYMVGGYVGVAALETGASLPLAVAAGGLAGLAVGFVLERVLLVRVRGIELSEALLTIAVARLKRGLAGNMRNLRS